jgi:hypothetical protein
MFCISTSLFIILCRIWYLYWCMIWLNCYTTLPSIIINTQFMLVILSWLCNTHNDKYIIIIYHYHTLTQSQLYIKSLTYMQNSINTQHIRISTSIVIIYTTQSFYYRRCIHIKLLSQLQYSLALFIDNWHINVVTIRKNHIHWLNYAI